MNKIIRLCSVCTCCGYCDLADELENNPDRISQEEDGLILLKHSLREIETEIEKVM